MVRWIYLLELLILGTKLPEAEQGQGRGQTETTEVPHQVPVDDWTLFDQPLLLQDLGAVLGDEGLHFLAQYHGREVGHHEGGEGLCLAAILGDSGKWCH